MERHTLVYIDISSQLFLPSNSRKSVFHFDRFILFCFGTTVLYWVDVIRRDYSHQLLLSNERNVNFFRVGPTIHANLRKQDFV